MIACIVRRLAGQHQAGYAVAGLVVLARLAG
jgi:hypothetical protein